MEKKTKSILIIIVILALAAGAAYYFYYRGLEAEPPSLESMSTTFQGSTKDKNKFSWSKDQIASFEGIGNENKLEEGLNWRYFDKKITTSELFLERIVPIENGWAKALVYNSIENECIEGEAGFVEIYKADDRGINDFCPLAITVSGETFFHGGLNPEDYADFDRIAGNLSKIKEKITEDTWVLIPLPKDYNELQSTTNYYFLNGPNSDQLSSQAKVEGANLAWVKVKSTVFEDEIVAILKQNMDETHYLIDEVSLANSNEITMVIKGRIDTEWSKDVDNGILAQTDAGHKIYWAGQKGKIRATFKFEDGKNFFVDASDVNYYTTDEDQVIVAVYDGQTMYLYRDGELLDSRKIGRNLKTSTGPTSIGASPEGENYFKGYLKEVSIYNRAFTPEEVAAIKY
ncbi:MAG: LamG domain-containing protein [Nitrospirota bacterium]